MSRLDWRPLSGLIHAYRDPAVAELQEAEAELAQRGLRSRVHYTLHGYQAQAAVPRPWPLTAEEEEHRFDRIDGVTPPEVTS